MSDAEKKRLPLSEMLNHIAEEIKKADLEARLKSGPKVMRFEECEVEVVFELELDVGGKVNLWAVELGTKGVQTVTHKLKVKYHAVIENEPKFGSPLDPKEPGLGGFFASIPPV